MSISPLRSSSVARVHFSLQLLDFTVEIKVASGLCWLFFTGSIIVFIFKNIFVGAVIQIM